MHLGLGGIYAEKTGGGWTVAAASGDLEAIARRMAGRRLDGSMRGSHPYPTRLVEEVPSTESVKFPFTHSPVQSMFKPCLFETQSLPASEMFPTN